MKKCKTCTYFPCTKNQCNIGNQEGCDNYENVVIAEIKKIDERIECEELINDFKNGVEMVNATDIQAIETVLKVHQDLQEEFFWQQIRIKNEYVKKDKIRAKIVEYKNLLMSCNRFSDVDRIKSINERILTYEELVEESNKDVN